MELAFLRSDVGNINIEEASRIGLKFFLRFFVTLGKRLTHDGASSDAGTTSSHAG